MNTQSLTVSYSAVKGLVGMFILLAASAAMAADPAPARSNEPRPKCTGPGETWVRMGTELVCVSKEQTEDLQCIESEAQITKAEEEFQKACGEAKLPGGCNTKTILSCIEEQVTDSDSDFGTLFSNMSALNIPGVPPQASALQSAIKGLNKTKGKCPHIGSKDFFERKDKLKTELETIQKDQKTLMEDTTKAQEDLNKEKSKLAERTVENRDRAQKTKIKVAEERQTTLAQMEENERKAAESLRKLKQTQLEASAQLTKINLEYTTQLEAIVANPQLMRASCINELTKARAELDENNPGISSDDRHMTLQSIWNSCMSKAKAGIQALRNKQRSDMDNAINNLRSIQSSVAETEQAMKSFAAQKSEALQRAQQQEQEAEAKLLQESQIAAQAEMDAQNALNTKIAAFEQRRLAIVARQQKADKELDSLGPEPKAGATKGWEEVQSAYLGYAGKVLGFKSCCGSAKFKDGKVCKMIDDKKFNSDLEKIKKGPENAE